MLREEFRHQDSRAYVQAPETTFGKGEKGDPGPAGPPPSKEEVRAVVREVIREEIQNAHHLKGSPGKDGATRGEIQELIYEVFNENKHALIGPQGPSGRDGRDGGQGLIGPEGPRGEQGSVGPEGPRGLTGSVGSQGPKGDPGEGIRGIKGDKGDPGKDGLQPEDVINLIVTALDSPTLLEHAIKKLAIVDAILASERRQIRNAYGHGPDHDISHNPQASAHYDTLDKLRKMIKDPLPQAK